MKNVFLKIFLLKNTSLIADNLILRRIFQQNIAEIVKLTFAEILHGQKVLKKSINNIHIRLDANYRIDWNFAPDSGFILLYPKSKKYVENPPRYGWRLPCLNLKYRIFWYCNTYFWFYFNYTKAGKNLKKKKNGDIKST